MACKSPVADKSLTLRSILDEIDGTDINVIYMEKKSIESIFIQCRIEVWCEQDSYTVNIVSVANKCIECSM